MRHAVLAAALAFGPHVKLIRPPVRRLARVVLGMLDRRRDAVDQRGGALQ